MSVRVRVLLVARNGAAFLERTLTALASQTRRPDSVTAVDGGSSDGTAAVLAAGHPTQFVSSTGRGSFGTLVSRGLQQAPVSESANEWLWLLAHDNAPAPGALAALLGAVEVAPSVAVAGPKLMEWNRPDYISSYGTTITSLGATVEMVESELDQAQHDRTSDVLAVSGNGMLVRRSVWESLGGFDPALPSMDAALDFCIRVRLAGHRIVGVPTARVASSGGPETFGKRSVSTRVRSRLRRSAELHRRMTYAPALAVPVHWASLLPLAIGRSVAHLVAKRPAEITGEFSAAVSTAFSSGIVPARRNFSRTRKLGWAAIAPFRMSWSDVRETRANRRDATAVSGAVSQASPRLSFFGAGGAWIVVFVAAISFVAFSPYLGATSLSGGALAPLSAQLGDLWSNVGYGWREIGAGFVGAADPFAYVLAVLGSLTLWAPSQAVVLLYVLALPLAALAGWWCAARFTSRAWPAAVAAILWAFSPPLLASLAGGHLGAVIAHLLLPWLVLAMLNAAHSWSAAAASGLLMAAIIAGAPALAPALLIAWLAWLISQPKAISRLVAIPLPTIALFAPLIVQQLIRGTPLALFADPGVTFPSEAPSGWQLAVLSPVDGFHGWESLFTGMSLPALSAPVTVAALLAPLGVLALLGLFLPGSRRAVPSMVLALLGFVTAVATTHLELALAGSTPVAGWAGAGLSVFWLGLLGSAIVALDALGTAVTVPSLLVVTATVALAVPLIAAPITGTALVVATSGRMLPAFVTAEAATDPLLGTLELIAHDDGGLAAVLHRGAGTTLDARSTLSATSTTLTPEQERIAVLAGNLASISGFDAETELTELGIGFVLSSEAPGVAEAPAPDGALSSGASTGASTGGSNDARATRARVGASLDANPSFTAIGDTANGYLWSFDGAGDDPGSDDAGSDDAGLGNPAAIPTPDPLATPLGAGILGGQLLILVMTLLLAIPTPGRARIRSADADPSEPASTFEEDDNV